MAISRLMSKKPKGSGPSQSLWSDRKRRFRLYKALIPRGHVFRGPKPRVRMSYTNSKTWVAPKMAEQEKFDIARTNLERMEFIPRSPFVPRSMEAWLAHRIAYAEDCKQDELKRLSDKQAASGPTVIGGRVRVMLPLNGKRFHDNRSAVLASKSIWTLWYEPTEGYPQAPWPSLEEMKEEGDERNTSGFGRFPALPRVPGNETVVWKQKNVIVPYPFDGVWELPKIQTGQPTYDEAAMNEWIGEELTKEFDS